MGFDWKFLQPARVGDTIRSASKTVAKRLLKEGGVVIEERTILNQRDEVVQSGKLTLLVARRPAAVSAAAAARPDPHRVLRLRTQPRGRDAGGCEFRRDGALPRVVDHFYDLVHPEFDRLDAEPLLRRPAPGVRCSGAAPTGWATSSACPRRC